MNDEIKFCIFIFCQYVKIYVQHYLLLAVHILFFFPLSWPPSGKEALSMCLDPARGINVQIAFYSWRISHGHPKKK